MSAMLPIQPDRLLATFLDLLAIDSLSGQEEQIMGRLQELLAGLGVSAESDPAGNLIGRLPGRGEPMILCAHVDHVPPCQGIRPVVEQGIIRSDGRTILGGDDTSGVAIMLELLQAIRQRQAEEPDWTPPALELVFTVREETGLLGSKALDYSALRGRQALVLDMGGPLGPITVQGPSQIKLLAKVWGKRAHAGCAPEEGINAIRVAAEAIAAMPLGRIDHETTANIGVIRGGEATNIVPDLVELHGEARSLREEKLVRQRDAMAGALEAAVQRHGARLELEITPAYRSFCLSPDTEIVARVAAAARQLGLEPAYISTGGGSDANTFNEHGIAAINISTGMEQVHTTNEWIALEAMVQCARWTSQIICD